MNDFSVQRFIFLLLIVLSLFRNCLIRILIGRQHAAAESAHIVTDIKIRDKKHQLVEGLIRSVSRAAVQRSRE